MLNDPIADIIDECAVNLEPPNEDSFVPFEKRDQIIAYTAKQIRQQIGQELLERRHQLDEFVRLQDIHEVCQLEES